MDTPHDMPHIKQQPRDLEGHRRPRPRRSGMTPSSAHAAQAGQPLRRAYVALLRLRHAYGRTHDNTLTGTILSVWKTQPCSLHHRQKWLVAGSGGDRDRDAGQL